MSKPRILVARAIFPDIVERLRQHFEVQDNPEDVIWTPAELAERLADKDGAFTTGSQRIDAGLLAVAPRRAMPWPMRPMPMMPSVLPWMSEPANMSTAHLVQRPARR